MVNWCMAMSAMTAPVDASRASNKVASQVPFNGVPSRLAMVAGRLAKVSVSASELPGV